MRRSGGIHDHEIQVGKEAQDTGKSQAGAQQQELGREEKIGEGDMTPFTPCGSFSTFVAVPPAT